MTLNEQLQKFREEMLNQISAEDAALMMKATEDLIQSGIIAQCLHQGDKAPDFVLPNANNEMVHFSHLLEQGPAVVTFYRGVWCPYCSLQLRAYQNILPQIKALGASLVAISPQLPDKSLSMAEKNELSFELLSDLGNKVARQYGLVYTLAEQLRPLYKKFGIDLPEHNADESYKLPIAGTFVILQDKTIRRAFVDADYTRRMEPAEMLAALQQLRKGAVK